MRDGLIKRKIARFNSVFRVADRTVRDSDDTGISNKVAKRQVDLWKL
jgi:hypothetical protein